MSEEKHRYRKVQPRMWADPKIRRLTWPPPNGLTLFQYLMTGRETVALPGAMEVTEEGLAARLRWSLEGFREAFAEVSREGLAKADWEACLVWLPGGPKNNKPESPNVVKSWGTAWRELPECELKLCIFNDVQAYVEGLGKGFRKAFEEAWPHPSPNQEQEQEQEDRSSNTPQTPQVAGVELAGDEALVPLAAAYADVTGRRDLARDPLAWSGVHRQHLLEMHAKCDGDPEDLRRQLQALLDGNEGFMLRQGLHHWVKCLGVPVDAGTVRRKSGMAPVSSAAEWDELQRQTQGGTA